MKAASCKGKGRRLQKAVAEKIGELTGCTVGKDEEVESREMGQSGTDIKLYGEAKKMFPYAVECKNTEKWQMNSYIKQARDNIGKLKTWLLFLKKNRQDTVVCMEMDEFFSILKELKELKDERKG